MKSYNESQIVCCDLDDTFIKSDILWELIVRSVKGNLFSIFKIFFLYFNSGPLSLKKYLFRTQKLEIDSLPVNSEVMNFLKHEWALGKKIVLVTASIQEIANLFKKEYKIFDQVYGSVSYNLKGAAKADFLIEKFGRGGFDYIGDSLHDMPVWSAANKKYLVSDAGTGRNFSGISFKKVFKRTNKKFLYKVSKHLRLKQWIKNLLILVPVLTAQPLLTAESFYSFFSGFLSFSLLASTVYILNDLMDLDSDRVHASKKNRPIASGEVSIPAAIRNLLILISTATGLFLYFDFSVGFYVVCSIYYLATILYSFKLKQVPILDVVTLAFLYTLRVVSGHFLFGINFSAWLLLFSFFIFTSLGFLKRYIEIKQKSSEKSGSDVVHGRGYIYEDLGLIETSGVSLSMASVVIFGLYLDSDAIRTQYSRPEILWLVLPLLLFWVTRVWFIGSRKKIADDPVLFVAKDKMSYATVIIVLAMLGIAK